MTEMQWHRRVLIIATANATDSQFLAQEFCVRFKRSGTAAATSLWPFSNDVFRRLDR
jgi:hypothetical protein